MNLRGMSVCSLMEIHNLSADPSALESMKSFCKAVYGTGTANFVRGRVNLYSFYIFSAAVPTPNTSGDSAIGTRLYGDEFAAFIRDNNLGDLSESVTRVNAKFHEGHSNRVWVWAPDFEAIKAWWNNELLAVLGPVKPAFIVPEGNYVEFLDEIQYDAEA